MSKQLLTKEELLAWINGELDYKEKGISDGSYWEGFGNGYKKALRKIKEKSYE